MKNVLVTGGAGFIGSNFVRHLLSAPGDVRVVNLDALTYAGSRANLQGLPDESRHELLVGNICDRECVERILEEKQIDTLVHFAAESHVDRSISGPAAFIETNITGTFTLLEAVRRVWRDGDRWRAGVRFHHVSTDEVFGTLGPGDPAFSESNAYAPNSPYAASKASSDHLVRAYAHTFGLPMTISNCSNNYGPYQFPEKLIPLMIFNALCGKPLPVYGDGRQVRDWLFVGDHCEAICQILKRGEIGQTYNIGGDNQPENIEIVRRICQILDEQRPDSPHVPHSSLIRYVADRPGHDRRYAMDIRKIERSLGWRPQYDLERGLRATVEWYLGSGAWLEGIGRQSDFQSWMVRNYAARGART